MCRLRRADFCADRRRSGCINFIGHTDKNVFLSNKRHGVTLSGDPMPFVLFESCTAAATTAACGRNREEPLGQRPARHECRPRHEMDAGSRNPTHHETAVIPVDIPMRWEPRAKQQPTGLIAYSASQSRPVLVLYRPPQTKNPQTKV